MKVGIMQPYFCPYIGYWQLINAVDIFVIYDDVNYIKKGWITRNNILVDGEARYITIKLVKASQNKLINELEVFPDQNYYNDLIQTIKTSYRKAPFLKEVLTILEEIFEQKELNLSKYLAHSIRIISNYLEIDTKIIFSSEIEKNNNLKAQSKIIDICTTLRADEYINAIGGQSLYSKQDFLNENISLKFLKTKEIRYQQHGFEGFIPNLSIIDVLMFNHPTKIKEMLNEYELV